MSDSFLKEMSARSSPRSIEAIRRWALSKRAFNSPRAFSAVWFLRRTRRRAFERIGSDRYSQPSFGQLESKLVELLPQTGGVFVEAGAYDGYCQSNTYWLERFRGWTGVLIEPIPELADRARHERPRSQVFECALVAPDAGEDSISMLYGGTMSLVKGALGSATHEREHAELGARVARDDYREVVVPARTLSDVLDDARVEAIDLLSLDVEGYEVPALRGLDLSRHTPRFVLIEMFDANVNRPQIEAVLGSRYRYHSQLSLLDHVYVRVSGD
jgi:FkbM family methyltransferase